MKEINYQKVLDKILDLLAEDNIIDDVDWGCGENAENVNVIVGDMVYGVEFNKEYGTYKKYVDELVENATEKRPCRLVIEHLS